MRCEGPDPNSVKHPAGQAGGYELSSAGGSNESASRTCAGWYNHYQKSLFSRQVRREHIEVFYPEHPRIIADDLIHSRIIFALFTDGDVDDTHISVRVEKGLVTLSGSVRDDLQKHRAGSIARREKGVIAVRNILELLPPDQNLDRSIALGVKSLLEGYTLIDTRAIEIRVKGGVVTLRGTVPNHNARDTAGRVASRTPGVVDVRNALFVQPAQG